MLDIEVYGFDGEKIKITDIINLAEYSIQKRAEKMSTIKSKVLESMPTDMIQEVLTGCKFGLQLTVNDLRNALRIRSK